jgi:hypothetical protein
MILDMIQGCRYLRRSTDRWLLSKNSTTRLKDSKVATGPVCCETVRCLLQTRRVYIYTLVLTRLLVNHEYNINVSAPMSVWHPSSIRPFLIFRPHHHVFPNVSFSKHKTALLPNDGVLPTAGTFTECFKENFLPNGVSLLNSSHKSVSFPYQFLVLTPSAGGRRTVYEEHFGRVFFMSSCFASLCFNLSSRWFSFGGSWPDSLRG